MFNVLSKLSTKDDLDILLRGDRWECQWDPDHWIDRAFLHLKGRSFIKRVLNRVALFHQIFRHGMMFSIAKDTAVELDLPFRVINTYAQQRFMSSSYLSLKGLEISYEAYVETFRDHDNDQKTLFKLCGNDFIFYLCGLLDLLWPVVILKLKAQLQWLLGRKFSIFVEQTISKIDMFAREVIMEVPSKSASPHLNEYAMDIESLKYKSINLEQGWIAKSDSTSSEKITWITREISDCRNDILQLTYGLKNELKHDSRIVSQGSLAFYIIF